MASSPPIIITASDNGKYPFQHLIGLLFSASGVLAFPSFGNAKIIANFPIMVTAMSASKVGTNRYSGSVRIVFVKSFVRDLAKSWS